MNNRRSLAQFRNMETHQLTTFNPISKEKTIAVRRGEKVTIGEVQGQGYITQLWMTFPGWFWQHWSPESPISQTILKTDTLNSSVVMYRIHDSDAINFNESIRFQFINPRSQDRLKKFAFSSVAYYYSNQPGQKKDLIPSVEDLLCWYRTKNTDRLSVP